MDIDAVRLVLKWNIKSLKDWYLRQWYDALDCAEAFLRLLLIVLRIILSPIVVLLRFAKFRSEYKEVVSGKVDREKLRKNLTK